MIKRSVSITFLAFAFCLPLLALQNVPTGIQSPSQTDAQKALAKTCAVELEAAKKELDPEKKQPLLQKALTCVRNARSEAVERAKIEAANSKAEKELDALTNKKLSNDEVRALTSLPVTVTAAPTQAGASVAVKPTQTNPAAKSGASATPSSLAVGTEVSQSKWGTRNACAVGTSTPSSSPTGSNGQPMLLVGRELMRPQDASDDYGRRLGKRFIIYQVTITNNSADFQFEVSDILVDLKPVYEQLGVPGVVSKFGDEHRYGRYQASSEDLMMLRGIPEKGQDYDPRNMTLHVFQGIGSVAAGVSGLTSFSDVMGSAVANFNGAFIAAFTGIAPDHTGNQLNRLSDTAFTTNTLIGKLQSKTFAIFIPESFVLPKHEMKKFWDDPRTLLNWLPLDQLNVCVSGIVLVQAQTVADPTFSTSEHNVIAGTKIALADATPGATIYYTIDGNTPTTNSPTYSTSTAITVGAVGKGELIVKAFATANNMAPSNVVVQTYTPAPQALPPHTPTLDSSNKVTITPATPGDVIFYTTDGSTPTRNSSVYNDTPFLPPPDATAITAVEVGNDTAISQPSKPLAIVPASPSTPPPTN